MIVRTRGGDMEYRTALGTLLSQYGLGRTGYGPSAGVPVTTRTVAGIPAVHAAITFAAESVAVLPCRVWRGDGVQRKRITSTWQARLFRATPNDQQTWFNFWEYVQGSLDSRGNAYVWKSKNAAGQVVTLYALHPDQVSLTREGQTKRILYRVAFGTPYSTPLEVRGRYKSASVGSETILHIRGRGAQGELVSPSPITLFRSALGVAVAKIQHEANVFEHGAAGGLVVSFPAGVNRTQAEEWRDEFDSRHAGSENAGRTKVVGSGAEIKQIGMTQQDAQFVESVGLSVLDVARIFGVDPDFIFAGDKTKAPESPESRMQRWYQIGLYPRLRRIEAALNSDPDLFSTASDYAAFDSTDVIRADLATQAEIIHKKVQSGVWLQDEARALEGLPPLPGGVGSIPLNIPVGGGAVGTAIKT